MNNFTRLDAQRDFLGIYDKYRHYTIKQANDALTNKQDIPLNEALVLSAIMVAIKSGDPAVIAKLIR